MNTRNFSIFLAGFIWLLVAIRIGYRGLLWLKPYFVEPDWRLSLLVFSFLIGMLKAFTVLKKAAYRNMANIEKISDNPLNYFIGWLIIYGFKGTLMISFMIGLGFSLRYLKSIGWDQYNLFGFLYLGIALGIAIASGFYFRKLKSLPK
jgi:hypothetical protein